MWVFRLPKIMDALDFFNFRDSFWQVFSFIYGIGIIMVGILIFTFDLFGKTAKTPNSAAASEIYTFILSLIGIIIIAYLMYDIQKYNNMIRDYYENDSSNSSMKLVEGPDGELIISMPLVKSKAKKLPQYYCFTTGRHSGSFFLKIGAAFFCIGSMIHMMVTFTKNILSLKHQKDDERKKLIKLLFGQILAFKRT